MKIAYIIFNKITWLDLIGIYDPLSRLQSMGYMPNLSWDVCSFTSSVSDNFGLKIVPDKIQNSLAEYEAIIVPGGHGTRHLQYDDAFIEWIRTAAHAKYKISICTGSLLLGAAGFLANRKATTNYNEYENLKQYCREVSEDRIVEDGDVITAGAVSASLDLGLYLCQKWAGPDAQNEIRKKMDYRG
jgi:transcriptional regulator GlxA family with amidase domain